jgi:hypothetical protein
MGILNNSSITVDAILTKYGRKKLAQGQALGITKYTFYDDGVDYALYNTGNNNGSQYYDEAITSIPMLEVVPDHSVISRWGLRSGEQLQTVQANILLTSNEITIENRLHEPEIAPQTQNFSGAEEFWFEFKDTTYVEASGYTSVSDDSGQIDNFPPKQGIRKPKTYRGSRIALHAFETDVNRELFITVRGVVSEAVSDIRVTIKKNKPTVG